MEVRTAHAQDLSSLEQLESACFHKQRFPSSLLQSMITEPTFLTLVAVENRGVAGYGSSYLADGIVRIISIAVLPEARGRGIGGLLLIELEQRCLAIGKDRFCLEVAVSNLMALRLYISHGYEVKGLIKDYYGEGEDAFYLEKQMKR